MRRIVSLISVAILMSAVSMAESHAQAKKKDKRCVANFREACIKQCGARGGQLRLCPQYCDNRARELGC
jgi:hypothetical protein